MAAPVEGYVIGDGSCIDPFKYSLSDARLNDSGATHAQRTNNSHITDTLHTRARIRAEVRDEFTR
jgi:hypothetical protein